MDAFMAAVDSPAFFLLGVLVMLVVRIVQWLRWSRPAISDKPIEPEALRNSLTLQAPGFRRI